MSVKDQGVVTNAKKPRYCVIPRTLIFLTSTNPETQCKEMLLLKGAPTKRLWANKYNGLGGHVERDENLLASARRELLEESGIAMDALSFCGYEL
jgi:8-oxo-dGTP diphosphatase